MTNVKVNIDTQNNVNRINFMRSFFMGRARDTKSRIVFSIFVKKSKSDCMTIDIILQLFTSFSNENIMENKGIICLFQCNVYLH